MKPVMLAAACVCGFGLTACDRPEPAPPRPTAPAAGPPAAAPTPEQPAAPYVGLWAAREGLCPNGAWVFDEKRLTTAGEVACVFQAVHPAPSGFQVMATCSAEGQAKPYQFSLGLAGSGPARTLTVSRGPWDGPITLIRCPA